MTTLLPEEEAAEVAVLMDKLKKMTEITERISRSLVTLSGSADLVEKSVQPILNQTGTLTVLASNIDSGIAEIDKTMRLLDIVKTEDMTIRKGPQAVGLTEYLNSLKRLSEGLSKLKATNLRSSQKAVKDITGLMKTGATQLEDMFRSSLSSVSAPVEPLHYTIKNLPFPTLSSEKVTQLAVLNEFLSSTIAQNSGVQSNAQAIYAEVRGPYLGSSLSSLAQGVINTATKRTAAAYERGDNGIIHYAPSLQKIFDAEYDNISQLFTSSQWTKIYINTTQLAMTRFSDTIRQLNSHVKQNMMTDCFLAYDVIESVNEVAKYLGNKTGEKTEFVEALKPIRQTALASFFELIEDVRRRGTQIQAFPPDMGILELTTTVMGRLRRMTDYRNAVAGLLTGLGDKNWHQPFSATLPTQTISNFDVGADGSAILSNYCTESIELALNLIDTRAKILVKKPASVAALMINNVCYVETSAKRNGLMSILGISGGTERIEKLKKKALGEYLFGWKECAGLLLDTIHTSKTSSGGPGAKPNLSSKEKDAVKEKLKQFNTMFDELVMRHKQYSFPDKEVKQMLYKEVNFIVPLYGRFYDKYHDAVKDKHIKYDKAGLDAVLASLQ